MSFVIVFLNCKNKCLFSYVDIEIGTAATCYCCWYIFGSCQNILGYQTIESRKKLMNRPSFSLWNLDLPCSESLFSLFNFPQCFIMFQHRKLYICFYISTITQSYINTYIMELLFVCFLLCLLLYLNFQNQFLLRNININWVEHNLFLNGNSYYFAKIKHVFTKPKRIK